MKIDFMKIAEMHEWLIETLCFNVNPPPRAQELPHPTIPAIFGFLVPSLGNGQGLGRQEARGENPESVEAQQLHSPSPLRMGVFFEVPQNDASKTTPQGVPSKKSKPMWTFSRSGGRV